MSTNSPQKSRRPVAIAIVGWVLLIGAILNIIVGAASLFLSDELTRDLAAVEIFAEDDPNAFLTDAGTALVLGSYSLIVGIVQLVIAVGFWRAKRWAWVAAMSWQAFKLLVEVGSALAGEGNFVTVVFSIALVFLLNQAAVRRIFNIRPPENESYSVTSLNTFDSN